MAERAELLVALGSALAAAEPARPLVFVHPPRHGRRSTVHFVGTREAPRCCRWVVKVPNSGVIREDLPPPVPAGAQFDALRRAHAHLSSASDHLATPRPVVLLPHLDAYAMEFVPGESLARRIRLGAVMRPARLLAGVAAAASLLRALHALGPVCTTRLEGRAVVEGALERSRGVLAAAGLAAPAAAPTVPPAGRTVVGEETVLHGDFAPENVLLGATVTCLEPDLVSRGLVEQDVARFLTMLFEAPLFVVGAHVAAVQRLRRRAGRTFLAAYYAGGQPGPVLPALLYEALAARYAARHVDCDRRRPLARRVRLHLIRRHFHELLTEVSVW